MTHGPRPFFSHVRLMRWTNPDLTQTVGIAVHKGSHVVAHLTVDEALDLANSLVDRAERLQEPPC